MQKHTIYLVRHAEKADDGTKDPPLTEEGQARAEKLANMLKDEGIKSIYSSDYDRTMSTAAPLAEVLGIEIKIYDPNDKNFSKEIVEEFNNGSILIVGHSNSTPTLVNSIIGREKFKHISEDDYSKIFKVRKVGKKWKPEIDEY